MLSSKPKFSFRDNLMRLMAAKGLKESDVIKATGLSQATISNILRGKSNNPRPIILKLLADLFGLSIEQLIGYEKLGVEASPKIDLNNAELASIFPLTIPLVPWSEIKEWILGKNLNKHYKIWLANDICKSQKSFALKAKPSMRLTFPYAPSKLLVDPEGNLSDGSLILIFLENSQKEPSIRLLKIDGEEKILQSLEKDIPSVFLNDKHLIVGTISEVRFNQETVSL
jgi:transcriptional regulator with XRE-family HTH domain